jgi:hypothetical protein
VHENVYRGPLHFAYGPIVPRLAVDDVELVVGRAGEDCTAACGGAGGAGAAPRKECVDAALMYFNSCPALRSSPLGCPGGCGRSTRSPLDQPAMTVADGRCFFTTMPAYLNCGAEVPGAKRICPCRRVPEGASPPTVAPR